MTEFLVFAALLMAASLVFVLVPLWRAGTPTPNKRREANITIYHQRYAEIEREVAAGRLSRREAETEKDELGARLLADIDAAPELTDKPRAAGRPWFATLLIAVLLIGGSAGTYWLLGDMRAMTGSDMPDLSTMIDELEARVAAEPDDLQARAMLARAQQARGEYAKAARNFRALNEAMPQPRAPIVAAEAAATLQASDDLQGRTRELYEQVLELDAGSAEALWYLGLAAAERGDTNTAIDYWDRLLEQDLPEDFASMVRNRRAELAGDKPALEGG
jgi:cytochrome c-type biogenesis protein CcmH